jgi:hypothetical protein
MQAPGGPEQDRTGGLEHGGLTGAVLVACAQAPETKTAAPEGASPAREAEMKPARSGYAEVNGLKLYHEIYGSGEPLVLIHSGLTTIGEMQGWVQPLAKTRQVIAVEMQGHGRTADTDRRQVSRRPTDQSTIRCDGCFTDGPGSGQDEVADGTTAPSVTTARPPPAPWKSATTARPGSTTLTQACQSAVNPTVRANESQGLLSASRPRSCSRG